MIDGSDQINPKKYEFPLFHDQRDLVEYSCHPARFWHVTEFYPSYMMIKTAYIVAGQMPIDLPWFYAWLTVMDEESRTEGFIIANLVNTIPPKHYLIGIYTKTQTDQEILDKYYNLRQTVKDRIEAFWNGLEDWHPLYHRMKDISWLLFGNPFDPPADVNPAAVNAEVREFEALIDRFFERFIEPESMDQFYTRMMKEIETNERKFEE